jgi:hydroxyethylthiazole kinase-like uncharacterized protein yjeF
VLTPDEMAEADRRTIAAGTPMPVLMERAGRAVAWAVRRGLGRTYGMRAVVACGKGNNGGDGLVAARVLRGWGVRVDVVPIGAGLVEPASFARLVGRADAAVDAMFGTGFRGELTGDARVVAEAFAGFDGPVTAVDIPSGVDGLTGEVRGTAVRAHETVCFAARKPGVCFEPGRALAGTVRVVDIGIPVAVGDGVPPTFVVEPSDVVGWVPARSPDAHKWHSGCFVVGGARGMTGAALLASRAALRAGAGIVWCGVPGSDAAAGASGTEVITRALATGPDGMLAESAAREVLDAATRFRAFALGPGLGRSPGAAQVVREIVAGYAGPLVLDADALLAIGDHLDVLRGRPTPAVLTPHAGEYAAIRGAPPGGDRLAAARELAAESGAVVLLKGPGTVVAAPDGRAAICLGGGPWLATAGTGDVLTGIVAAFLARGSSPFEAAAAAAFVHASAADWCGHTGLVAGDLVDAIPRSLETLDAGAGSAPR